MMKMLLQYLGVSLIILSLASCLSIVERYEANPIMKQQSKLLEKDKDVVDVEELQKRVSQVDDKAKRNELINELITISDRVCSRHQAAILANVNAWNIVTGTTTNLLSALGTVIGGEVTKASLAAAATFSSSTRSLVNEEVYVETLGAAIVRAISVAREKYYAEIENGMMKELTDYTVSKGLRDVQEYHRRCSFYYGLLEISKSLEQRKKSKQEISNDIQKLKMQYEFLMAERAKGGKVDTDDILKRIQTLILEQPDAPN